MNLISLNWTVLPLRFLNHIPKKKIILAFGDGLLVVMGLAATRIPFSLTDSSITTLPLGPTVFLLVSLLLCFQLASLYSIVPPFKNNQQLSRVALAVTTVTGSTAVVSSMFPAPTIGTHRLILLGGFLILACFLWRRTFELVLHRFLRPVHTLIIGAGSAGSTIASLLLSLPEFNLLGFIDDDPEKQKSKGLHGLTVLGGSSDIRKLVQRHRPNLIVLAITHKKRDEVFRQLLDCRIYGIELLDMPTLYEHLTGKVPAHHIRDSWFVYNTLQGVRRTFYATRTKRLLDIVLSSLALLIAVPLSLITSLAIIIESGLPVLYLQKRTGHHEKDFWLVKLRSMTIGAEAHTGPVWAGRDDGRITKVGRAIRLFRIDEIAQLWNVLKGEMSLVGPRPERPEFVKKLKAMVPYYSVRHTVKPGITGWAQINYPYGSSEEDALEKLQYDLYYLKHMSLSMDLHILLRTIRVVLLFERLTRGHSGQGRAASEPPRARLGSVEDNTQAVDLKTGRLAAGHDVTAPESLARENRRVRNID